MLVYVSCFLLTCKLIHPMVAAHAFLCLKKCFHWINDQVQIADISCY